MANERARGLGYKFVTDDKYLVDPFSPTDGISYEGDGSPVSYANSMGGIMTQAPIPGPLKYIPEGDGGGRDPDGPAPDTGAVTADDFGYGLVEDMGMTEEEQAGVDSINNAKIGKMGLAKTIGAFAFMGPFAGIFQAYRENKKAKQDAIDKAKAAQTQRDAEIGADKGIGPGGSGSRRGNADISDDARGGFATDDTASFFAKGGRAGYFFGGRVNYKQGGRIGFKGGGGQIGGTDDMSGGSKDKGNPDDNREQYGAVGQYSKGPPSTRNNDDGPKKTFFNNPTTLYENSVLGSVPTGFTTTTPYGRLSAIMDLNKTLEEENLEGKVQFDSSIGPVSTRTSYDTTIGPEFNASYSKGPVSIDYNSLDGITAGYNKGPVSIGYNNGQTTLEYSKSFAKGGRVGFKNGGLASIL